MTKDEALKLALEALEADPLEMVADANGHMIFLKDKAITAIKEALAESEPNYKKALEVWLDKTEWVQETVKPHELGMHRADVLKQRIEDALAVPTQHQDWCASLTQMLMSMPPKPAPCNCKPPQRTWVGLTNEEVTQIIEMGLGIRDSIETALDKLKEKNT
jgi:hypothetical protein